MKKIFCRSEGRNMKLGNAHGQVMFKPISARGGRARLGLLAILVLMGAAGRTASALTINLTLDTDAKLMAAVLTAADITNMKAACSYASAQFTNRYNDPINVIIMVTASPGKSDLGS